MARYLPFGDYRTTPTQTVTDRLFTGHKHNDDLGLVYMNARFYVPSIGRFASADTIVPDHNNPQSYNRYSYVYNNPVAYTDPSGHCRGHYDFETGQATEDQDCWDFLYNEFCSGGSIAVCSTWQERVYSSVFLGCFGSEPCLISFEGNYWTKHELTTLRDSLAAIISALNGAGYAGYSILEGVGFTRTRGTGYSMTFPSSHIYLGEVNDQTIWHETGHTISFRNGRTAQDEYFKFAIGFAFSPWGYELNDFCYQAYCHTKYNQLLGLFRLYTGNHPEYFADGFAAWVYMQTNGSSPIGPGPSNNWVGIGYDPNWHAISRAVEWSLTVTFNP